MRIWVGLSATTPAFSGRLFGAPVKVAKGLVPPSESTAVSIPAGVPSDCSPPTTARPYCPPTHTAVAPTRAVLRLMKEGVTFVDPASASETSAALRRRTAVVG